MSLIKEYDLLTPLWCSKNCNFLYFISTYIKVKTPILSFYFISFKSSLLISFLKHSLLLQCGTFQIYMFLDRLTVRKQVSWNIGRDPWWWKIFLPFGTSQIHQPLADLCDNIPFFLPLPFQITRKRIKEKSNWLLVHYPVKVIILFICCTCEKEQDFLTYFPL